MSDDSRPELTRLFLIRGLPGSGKTRLVEDYVAQGYQHLEADQFFMDSGQHRFDKEKQAEAHAWCLGQTRKALEGGGQVCVANVFATIPDVWPYTMLGVEYQFVEDGFPERSVLDVPAELILDLQRRWVPTEQMIEALRVSASPKRQGVATTSEELPDLTFDLEYSKYQVPLDLRRFLYKGGAGTDARVVYQKIAAGELGKPLKERIGLVRKMHEVLADALGRGKSRHTVYSLIELLKTFFTWGDESGSWLDIDSVERAYLDWTDALLQRARVDTGFREKRAYSRGKSVGWVLDRVLDRDNLYPILKTTRLRKPKESSRFKHSEADKQHLGEIESFGRLLMDIIDGLGVDAIWGTLPVLISLRDGTVLEEWSGIKHPSFIKPPNPAKYPYSHKRLAQKASEKRAAWEADRTLRTRSSLVNLRIQAEMLVFISQTGMNLAQAHQMRVDKFSFQSSTQGYAIRAYKTRRSGEVLFEIHKEYRKVFEEYLAWRKAIFPENTDGLLFPLITDGRLGYKAPQFQRIITVCKGAGIKYFPPGQLRKTKANFVARVSGAPEMEAAVMQHSIETFLASYEEPNHQRTIFQVSNFWAVNDPSRAAPGPGSCAGNAPQPIVNIPPTATRPDCVTPAGCLFCEHQRDIDSLDHLWSLATYRYLKSFELAAHHQPESKKDLPKHPAELVIERLTAKLAFIKASRHQANSGRPG